ncbi:MAG: exo-beta-N-acetylmuramidase NamZ domain-containing protein [Hydrogenophaga sp.]
MKLGIERLLTEPALREPLKGQRLALLAHPASVTRDLTHSIDAIAALPELRLSAAFGPQHGLRGDKQDNMVESPNYIDPRWGIPIYSLYGEVRRPTDEMMASFDVLLVDLQDLGCRIYTFITTLRYVLEAAAAHGKSVWVLDRPNPAGRPVEGLTLQPGWESFVGAGPMPMRHGMTMGELGHWFIDTLGLTVDYRVITMSDWAPESAPGFGWPSERSWVNPSPNAANLSMARAYAGTVMLEGTTLSEGRGTTRPLELFGAPDIDANRVIEDMRRTAPQWLKGCVLRSCFFEPTFHKHAHQLCAGVQIHVEDPSHYDHQAFQPWRLQALAFRAVRMLQPDYPLWRDFPYEYEHDRLAIDLINGGPGLREWVDDLSTPPEALEALAARDEAAWIDARRPYLLY